MKRLISTVIVNLLIFASVTIAFSASNSFESDNNTGYRLVKGEIISKAIFRRPGRVPVEAIVYFNGQSCSAILNAELKSDAGLGKISTVTPSERIFISLVSLECGKKHIEAHGFALGNDGQAGFRIEAGPRTENGPQAIWTHFADVWVNQTDPRIKDLGQIPTIGETIRVGIPTAVSILDMTPFVLNLAVGGGK